MRGQVLVADAKPRVLAGFREPFEHAKGVVLDPIAGFVVEDAGKPVDHRVHVRTDEEAPELVVIGRVGDNGQLVSRRNRPDSGGQRGAARPARQHDYVQRKRSSA